MLPIQYLREHIDEVVSGCLKKGHTDASDLVRKAVEIDTERRETQLKQDNALALANQYAKQVGVCMKQGNKSKAEQLKQQASENKKLAHNLQSRLHDLEQALTEQLYLIPNIPHPSVPEGKDEKANVVIYQTDLPKIDDSAVPHWDWCKEHGLIDFELGNKVTGAGFPFYRGKIAKLQRALVQFFLTEADHAGYEEIQPPIVVNEKTCYATGQLPDKEGQMYRIQGSDVYLIPTAEVPLTNIFRGEILDEKDLPVKMTGYTPCFRREAGSWGADVRGLNRLHQFDKVELVQLVHPEKSYEVLDEMCTHVQGLLEKLELPHRKLLLCGGDISFNAALCYDFEVYAGAQNKWLECSSVSNFEVYQANRLQLRFRDSKNKKHLLHTLNGSALALPRIMAALLENNQREGKVIIPEVLRPYCHFEQI